MLYLENKEIIIPTFQKSKETDMISRGKRKKDGWKKKKTKIKKKNNNSSSQFYLLSHDIYSGTAVSFSFFVAVPIFKGIKKKRP